MATEADISDPISRMKIEVEDKEQTTGNARIVPEELIDVAEKVESTLFPLFETTKVENSNDIADVHVINEGNVKAVKGENFLNSPSVFYEELEKNSKKDQLNSVEIVSSLQTGEKIDIKPNENNTRLVTGPTDCSQVITLDTERVRDVIPIMEKRDDTLPTEATLSQQVSTEPNFLGEDDIQNKYSDPLLAEKAKEEIKIVEISKHEPDHVVNEIVEENLEEKTDTLAEKYELDEPLELDRSFTHKNGSAIQNVEMLGTEASEEIDITPSSEVPNQIPVKEEDETTISGDAILLENSEEKNLSASDLDEKNGVTSDDLNSTSLLVEEEVQIISEKQNLGLMVETEHVDKKGNELSIKEEELDKREITNEIENVEEEVKIETSAHLVTESHCEENETMGKIGDEKEPKEPSKILGIEKVRYDGPIEEKGDNTLTTEGTLSRLELTETSLKGEDDSPNKTSESHLTENADIEADKVEMTKQELDNLTMKCEHEVAMIVTEHVEKPVTEASEELEITPTSETCYQISAKEDETTSSGDIKVLTTPEEENLTAEVVVTDKSGNNSTSTSPVEEEMQIMSEKPNQDSISEGPEGEQESKSSTELIQTENHLDKDAFDQIIKEEEFKEPEITNKRENIEEDMKNETLTEHATDSIRKGITSWDQGNETAEKVGDQEKPEEPSTLEVPKNKFVNDMKKSEDVSSLISQAPTEENKEWNMEDIKKTVEKADAEINQINVPLETENKVFEREINLDKESESNAKNVQNVYETTTSLCVEESSASEIQSGEHGETETKTQIEEGKELEGFDAVPESENLNFEEIHETKTSTSEINSEEISEINEAENLGSKYLDSHSIEEIKAIDQYLVSGQTPAEEEREELKPVIKTENKDDKIEDENTQQNETTVTKPDPNRVREVTNSELIPEPNVESVEDVDEIDSAKENIRISKQASDEIEISPTSEIPDQIPAKEDETKISGDIIVLATPDENELEESSTLEEPENIKENGTEKTDNVSNLVCQTEDTESYVKKAEINMKQIREPLEETSIIKPLLPEHDIEKEDLERAKNLDNESESNVKNVQDMYETTASPSVEESGAEEIKNIIREFPKEQSKENDENKTKIPIENKTVEGSDVVPEFEDHTIEEICETKTSVREENYEEVLRINENETLEADRKPDLDAIKEIKEIPMQEEKEEPNQFPELGNIVDKVENEITDKKVKNVQDVYETTRSLCVEESGESEKQNGEHDESETKTQIEEGKGLEGFDAVPESENLNFVEIHETKTSTSEINSEEISEINEAENLGSKKNLDSQSIEEIKAIDQYLVSGQTPAEEERQEHKPVTEIENRDDKIEDEITQQNETTVTKPDANRVREETNSELIPEPNVESVEDVDESDSTKENIEIFKQASEEIEISPTSELPDQTPAKEDETKIYGDIIVLATLEENNLIAIDLDEKKEAEVAATDNTTGDESVFSSPLLEEDQQIIDKKLDQDSKLETQIQVLEESEDPEGAQFVKKEVTEKSTNKEKDVNKETPAEHATGCNNEYMTRCTQEATVAKIGDGKDPEESSMLEEPENITENGTEKTDDVPSLVSQTEDTENCVEKTEIDMKQISEPLEEISIMKHQLPNHDIKKEDLERAENLDKEPKSNVKSVQYSYYTTANPSVEESGAEEIENTIREVPKEQSEENGESKTIMPTEHNTVEGSDAVPEFEDHTIEEICETKTSASEENYEEVVGINKNDTLEAERKPDLHAIKEIEEILIQEEKEEPGQFPEFGNIVDKVENEITNKNVENVQDVYETTTSLCVEESGASEIQNGESETETQIEQRKRLEGFDAVPESENQTFEEIHQTKTSTSEINSEEISEINEAENLGSKKNLDSHGIEEIKAIDQYLVSVQTPAEEEREELKSVTETENRDNKIEDGIKQQNETTGTKPDPNRVREKTNSESIPELNVKSVEDVDEINSAKESIEISKQASGDIEISPTSELPDQIQAKEDQTTISSDIIVLATAEENNLIAIDLDEKNEEAEVAATDNTGDESNFSSPLLEEDVQNIDKKLDQDSKSEAQIQVLEESEDPDGAQFKKKEEFEEPEKTEKSANVEKYDSKETSAEHATGCNNENTIRCTQEATVAKIGEGKEPEPENMTENGTEKTDDVSSLVFQTEDTENCVEKAETNMKQVSDPLEEMSIVKTQLPDHDIEKEDLERAKNLDNESETNVKNVQDIYETAASPSVEESGAEEIENTIREFPKEQSEENGESKTIMPTEHKTVEGSDAVLQFEDHTIEEICETKTSASEENCEEVLGNNDNETSEVERRPGLHAIKEIGEIPIVDKEECNQFPEFGNIVDKVENKITDKIETEVTKHEANEVIKETNYENTEIQTKTQPAEENDEIEQKPHVKETEADKENEETKNDDFTTPTLASEEISSKEFPQNGGPGNIADYVSSSENIDTHEKKDISQQNEGDEKIDLEDGASAVSDNKHEDEERESELTKVDDKVEEVSAPLIISEYKDQVIEDAIEKDLSSTVHKSDINEVSKVEEESPEKSPEVCGSNDQSFEETREMETEPTSEHTKNYEMEEETKEAKISKSIIEPNVIGIDEISEIQPTLTAGDIHAEVERADVKETDTEVTSLYDEVQELRTSEPVTQASGEKKDELDPMPTVGNKPKNEREETDVEMVKAESINKNGSQFNQDMADFIETRTAENVAQKELEILNPDAAREYTENKETVKQANEEIEATTKFNDMVTLIEDSESINDPIPTNATSSVITTPETIETVDTSEIDKNNLEETSTVECQLQEQENEAEVSEGFTAEETDAENIEVEKSEVPAVPDQFCEADINDEVAHGREIENGSNVEHVSKTSTIENREDGHMKNDDIEKDILNLQVSQLQNIETAEYSDTDVVQAEKTTRLAELKAEISGGKGKEEEIKIIAEKISADTKAVIGDEVNEIPHTLGKEEDHQELSSESLSEIKDENERVSETKTESNTIDVEEVNDDEANEKPLITGKSEEEYQETSSVILFEKQDDEGFKVSETKREANVVGGEELHNKESTVAKEPFSFSVEDQRLATGEFKEKHQPSSALSSKKQDENEEIESCETKTDSNVYGRDSTTDVEKTHVEKVEEEAKEDLETLPEPKGQDISLITGSEVISIGEIEISDEATKDFEISSEIKIPEAKERVDIIKFEETPFIESKLQEHENEKKAFKTVTEEKTDVEVDNKKILEADSESLAVENQGPKAVSNDEIDPSWTNQAENIEEEIQNSCSVYPSGEKNHENVTNTAKNIEDEQLVEDVPKALPEGETQCPDVVISDKISHICKSQIENKEEEVPESSSDFVSSKESHETTGKNTEDDSNDEFTPACTSQAENNKEEVPESSSVFLSNEESQENVPNTTKSTEDECEKVIQVVPKALPEGKTQGPDAVSNDEINPSWMSQAENFEEEDSDKFKEAVVSKSIPECEVLNVEEIQTEIQTTCEPEHEDAAEIIARYIIFNQTFPKENKEEIEMGVKETDNLSAAVTKEGSEREQVSVVTRESEEGSMGEINTIDEVIKASGGKIEEKGLDIIPESKYQSFEETGDTEKIMATEMSDIDKVEEDGSNLLEEIHGETYNILENESKKQQIEPCSDKIKDQDDVEDEMIKPEEINKNIALSHENVFALSKEGTAVENILSKPVDETCTETSDLEFEIIEKSLQPESEILGSVVNPTEKETDIVDEILEEPTENTIEEAQAIKEITSKESFTKETEKAETKNTLKEPTSETPEQVSTANANYAEKENDEKYVENEPIKGNKGNEYDNLATETTMSTKEVESLKVTMEEPEEKLVNYNEKDETAMTNTTNSIEEDGIKENVIIEKQETKTNALDFRFKKATPNEELAEITVDKEYSNFILDPVSITPKTEEQVEKLEPKETTKEPREEKKISLSLSQKQIAGKEYLKEEKENQNAIASRDFQVKSEDSTAEKQVECFEEEKHVEKGQTPKNPTKVTEEPKTEAEEKALVEEEKVDEEGEDDHKRTDSGSDAPVMVEASRDIDVKTPQKKSHSILSGVGSKVKQSISKVKKAITGKSSHQKASSPKEDKKTENVPLL